MVLDLLFSGHAYSLPENAAHNCEWLLQEITEEFCFIDLTQLSWKIKRDMINKIITHLFKLSHWTTKLTSDYVIVIIAPKLKTGEL